MAGVSYPKGGSTRLAFGGSKNTLHLVMFSKQRFCNTAPIITSQSNGQAVV